VADCYEHGNEISVSITGGESFNQSSDYELAKKDSFPSTCLVLHLLTKLCKIIFAQIFHFVKVNILN
jgi:hypothetical protein